MIASWLGHRTIELAECGSTNDEAARLARAGASHGTVVIADRQRSGRGREGRVWASPPGAGLYLSAIVRPPLPLAHVPPMTLAIGVGLCDAAREFGAAAVLKWPNDVLVGKRKLAGVLVEAQSQGSRLEAVVVGIGVNLATSDDLPEPLRTTAIALDEAAGSSFVTADGPGPRRAIARAAFVARLCAHVEHWIDRYVAGGLPLVTPAWQARMAPDLRLRVSQSDRAVLGEVAGLDGDGALLLRDDTGEVHRVRSGDVEVIRGTQASEQPLAPC